MTWLVHFLDSEYVQADLDCVTRNCPKSMCLKQYSAGHLEILLSEKDSV